MSAQLNNVLVKAEMLLTKWRSSFKDLLDSIPKELQESSTLHISDGGPSGGKALGLHCTGIPQLMLCTFLHHLHYQLCSCSYFSLAILPHLAKILPFYIVFSLYPYNFFNATFWWQLSEGS